MNKYLANLHCVDYPLSIMIIFAHIRVNDLNKPFKLCIQIKGVTHYAFVPLQFKALYTLLKQVVLSS